MGTDLLSGDGRQEERVRQPYCQQVHFLHVVNNLFRNPIRGKTY